MSLAGLRPVGRRGDAADRDRDDARRIPDRKIVSGQVLAQTRHRVLVTLVIVGAEIEIARRSIDSRSLEHRDDRLVVGPAADELVRLFHRLLEEIERRDRKSTRLNSSHSQISYAVFCLKKKKKNTQL